MSTNLYTSPQVVDLLGYSVEEWMRDAELWFRALHPDDRERAVAEHRAVERRRASASCPSTGSFRRTGGRCGSATRPCP